MGWSLPTWFTWPPWGQTTPASNTTNIGAAGGRTSQVQPLQKTTQGGASAYNPMFGRPLWTYVHTMAGPVRGPQPRLAQGSGHTAGAHALPGNSSQLPGYMVDQQYFPSTFSYDPVHSDKFQGFIPRTISTGDDGRSVVGTYKPHDFTPAQRFFSSWRSAASWQVYEYPPDFRNLLAWQQVQKYRATSFTQSARPLDSANYFLGYQVNPQISAQMGQGTLGYMGSS